MRLRQLLLLLASLTCPGIAGADPVVLYSNLGAGGTYDSSRFWVLEDDVTQEYAMLFRPFADGSLVQVSLPIQIVADPEFESRRVALNSASR